MANAKRGRHGVAATKSSASAAYPGKIRIIAGQWRGRKLPVLVQDGLRPTPDRVRETLFNWLMPVIEGARCLDLFAGSGALCLEALSRGAAQVVMVERAAHVADQLRRNVATLNAHGAEVIETDAVEFLLRPVTPFDIIFIDPPFASDLVDRCSRLVEEHGWLKKSGWIYVEAPLTLVPLPVPKNWGVVRSGTAGAVNYYLLRRISEAAP